MQEQARWQRCAELMRRCDGKFPGIETMQNFHCFAQGGKGKAPQGAASTPAKASKQRQHSSTPGKQGMWVWKQQQPQRVSLCRGELHGLRRLPLRQLGQSICGSPCAKVLFLFSCSWNDCLPCANAGLPRRPPCLCISISSIILSVSSYGENHAPCCGGTAITFDSARISGNVLCVCVS